jgi:hypothetical protein
MGANAQTSVPAFTAGQVLTAAQVTGINTGIPVFASSTERDAAFGGTGEKTLAEGQMAYLEDTNATQYYDGSSWAAVAGGKILQVVSTTKTDTFSASMTAGSTTTVTGLSATITPTSATSKVLVMLTHYGSSDGTSITSGVNLTRGGTAIATGDAAGSRTSASGGFYYYWNVSQGTTQIMPLAINYLDSPATTSATTYGVEWIGLFTMTQYLNRSNGDASAAASLRVASTITVMEVSA